MKQPLVCLLPHGETAHTMRVKGVRSGVCSMRYPAASLLRYTQRYR